MSVLSHPEPSAPEKTVITTPKELMEKCPRLEALIYYWHEFQDDPGTELLEAWWGAFSEIMDLFDHVAADESSNQVWAIFHAMKAQQLMLLDIIYAIPKLRKGVAPETNDELQTEECSASIQ